RKDDRKLTVEGRLFNPLTPMSDQDRVSPYNIGTISTRKLIQYQILQTNITRTTRQTVRRITDEILGVKGQTSDENEEKYQLADYKLIQYQFLHTNITRTVWQTVRRITNEILG
ncbi:hypothetical protein pdam_00015954, partial [Pocillopora damicornis]